MKKKPFIILFFAVVITGFVLRFYKLGTVLSGFPTDDAGLGYSAYSILKTGKDEFGKSFPIFFRSQGDFRTPVNAYLITVFLKVFGVNMLSVRLPSAIFGFLTIPALYLLIQEISGKKKLALLSASILAVSPWHIVFSRNAYDNTVSLFFIVFGFYLLFKSFKSPRLMFFSAISFAVSMVAYRVEQIIIPLMLLVVFIKYKNIFLEKSRRIFLILSIILGISVCLPLITLINTPSFWVRANVLGIFSFVGNGARSLSTIVNEKWFLSPNNFFEVYISLFSPRYIIALGDYLTRSSYIELPAVFEWQLPFYIWGLFALVSEQKLRNFKFLFFAMLLIFPIPAALARDPYSPMRGLQMVVPQTSIIAFGIYNIFLRIKSNLFKKVAIVIFLLAFIYSLVAVGTSFFILGDRYPQNFRDWGWKEVSYAIENLNTNQPIVVDDSSGSYLRLALFLKYDPAEYQKENYEVPLSEYYTNLYANNEKHIGNITFRHINWEQDLGRNGYLIGNTSVISDQTVSTYNLKVVSEIKYSDGTIAFRIVRTGIK